MRINSFVKLLSIPKSLYVSIRLCGFKNVFDLPILVRYNCKLMSLSGSALGNGKLDIGFGDVGIFDNSYQRCVLQIKSKIVMNGYSHFGPASKIVVGDDAILTIGDNVANSAACSIIAMKKFL